MEAHRTGSRDCRCFGAGARPRRRRLDEDNSFMSGAPSCHALAYNRLGSCSSRIVGRSRLRLTVSMFDRFICAECFLGTPHRRPPFAVVCQFCSENRSTVSSPRKLSRPSTTQDVVPPPQVANVRVSTG